MTAAQLRVLLQSICALASLPEGTRDPDHPEADLYRGLAEIAHIADLLLAAPEPQERDDAR